MSLQTIAASFEAFAAQIVADTVAEAGTVGAKLEAIAKEAVTEGAGALETGFEELVGKWGGDATKLVTDLMADDSLSGLEKSNLAATQLTEQAANTGITLAAQDVTTLIKSAYLAVTAEIAKL